MVEMRGRQADEAREGIGHVCLSPFLSRLCGCSSCACEDQSCLPDAQALASASALVQKLAESPPLTRLFRVRVLRTFAAKDHSSLFSDASHWATEEELVQKEAIEQIQLE